MSQFIFNASPLIIYGKIEKRSLIDQLMNYEGNQVLIPRGVADEIIDGPVSDSAKKYIESGIESFQILPVPIKDGIS